MGKGFSEDQVNRDRSTGQFAPKDMPGAPTAPKLMQAGVAYSADTPIGNDAGAQQTAQPNSFGMYASQIIRGDGYVLTTNGNWRQTGNGEYMDSVTGERVRFARGSDGSMGYVWSDRTGHVNLYVCDGSESIECFAAQEHLECTRLVNIVRKNSDPEMMFGGAAPMLTARYEGTHREGTIYYTYGAPPEKPSVLHPFQRDHWVCRRAVEDSHTKNGIGYDRMV